MSALLTLLILPCLFLTLPALRRWLRERREGVSATRTFVYRKFLTPGERRLREETFARLVERDPPAITIEEIGGIWLHRPCSGRILHLAYYRPAPRNYALWSGLPASEEHVSVVSTAWNIFQVCRGDRDPIGHALLVDEADTAGLDMLCAKLDAYLNRY
jgi:hypothetical protein